VNAVVDARGQIVQEQRLQALVHPPREEGEVVGGDDVGGAWRGQKDDERVVREGEVGDDVHATKGAADHAAQVRRDRVEDLAHDAPAEDVLETAVAIELDVEDGDAAAALELEADRVGDHAQGGQSRAAVAHEAAHRRLRAAERVVAGDVAAHPASSGSGRP